MGQPKKYQSEEERRAADAARKRAASACISPRNEEERRAAAAARKRAARACISQRKQGADDARKREEKILQSLFEKRSGCRMENRRKTSQNFFEKNS